MAARDAARLHAGDFERHHFVAQQRHHPADRTDEARAALPPAQYIVFGHWSFRIRSGSASARMSEARTCPSSSWLQPGIRPLACDGDRGRSSVDAHLLGEARPPRLARPTSAAPVTSSSRIRLPFGKPSARSTSRRGVASVQRDPARPARCPSSSVWNMVLQVASARADHPIGNLFGADLEQEGQRSCRHLRADCCAFQICATPTASLRTRAMTPTRSVTLIAPRESSRLNSVRALQHLVVGGQRREALLSGYFGQSVDQPLASPSCTPNSFHSASTSAISKLYTENLQLVGEPHVGVLHARRPLDVVHAVLAPAGTPSAAPGRRSARPGTRSRSMPPHCWK